MARSRLGLCRSHGTRVAGVISTATCPKSAAGWGCRYCIHSSVSGLAWSQAKCWLLCLGFAVCKAEMAGFVSDPQARLQLWDSEVDPVSYYKVRSVTRPRCRLSPGCPGWQQAPGRWGVKGGAVLSLSCGWQRDPWRCGRSIPNSDLWPRGRAEALSGLSYLRLRNMWWTPSRWRTRMMSEPGDISPQCRTLLVQPSPAAVPPVISDHKVKGRSCPIALCTGLPRG